MENKYNSYEYLEMLEPRRSSSLPTKCRSLGNFPKSTSTSASHKDRSSSSSSSSSSNNNNTAKPKQDDVQRIVHKIRNVFSILKSSKDYPNHPSSVIETDYEKDAHKERFDSPLTAGNIYGTFEDTHEYTTCYMLARQLKKCLASAKDKQLLCDLILPVNLLSRIAQDISRMSHCEPCGVRGGVVYIALDNGSSQTINIGTFVCDSTIVPTFELYLTMTEDTRSWVTMRKWLFYIQTCFREDKNVKKNPPKVLSDGFQLVKRKLYRPN